MEISTTLAYSNQIQDLEAAIRWMSAQGGTYWNLWLKHGRCGCAPDCGPGRKNPGRGNGCRGGLSKTFARRYPDDVADWKERGFIEVEGVKIGAQFIEDARRHDVIGAVVQAKVPLLVIHGLEDRSGSGIGCGRYCRGRRIGFDVLGRGSGSPLFGNAI